MERNNDERIVASIYKGKVRNLEDRLEAAFVDIGIEKSAFLHYWDILPAELEKQDEVIALDAIAGCVGCRFHRCGARLVRQQRQLPEVVRRLVPHDHIAIYLGSRRAAGGDWRRQPSSTPATRNLVAMRACVSDHERAKLEGRGFKMALTGEGPGALVPLEAEAYDGTKPRTRDSVRLGRAGLSAALEPHGRF